jgi:hypothetical protein
MGQYRIRKAQPGEIPGYYSREQLGLRRFAAGGAQEEDTSANISAMLPQLTNTIAAAVMKDADPENADIRPIMTQLIKQLQQSGVDQDAIGPLVNAAGQQALQLVARLIDQSKGDTPEPQKQTTEGTEDDAPDVEETQDYGYYDSNQDITDDWNAAEDDAINGQSMAMQDAPQAAMGMQVNNLQSYFPADMDPEDISEDYSGYETFVSQMKYGGAQGKKKFMKEVMSSLTKAAEGMQQKSGNAAALRGTADDIQGNKLSSKNTFIPSVKQTAQNEVNKKFAEQQYNTMMNQQFQFGGSNRRVRRANSAMFGTPFAPPGANASYNFGPFGGLRSASVEFDPRMLQGMFGTQSVMPGMISGQSGWYTPSYQIKGTRTKSSSETPTAQAAKAVNAESMDKVSKDTPNSEATSDKRTLEQMRADALKYAGVDATGGNGGWAAGTANSELNQGTNGNGTSGGNGASGTNTVPRPNPVRTTTPIVPTPKPVVKPKGTIKKGNEVIIPGKPFVYHKTSDGKWHFEDNKGKHGYVTNEKTIKDLNAGKFKLKSQWDKEAAAELNNIQPVTGMDPGNQDDFIGQYVLPFMGFPGAGAGAGTVDDFANFKFKQPNRLGAGQNSLNSGQKTLNPGQKMLNPGQRMLNPPAGYQFNLGFADGGAVNPNLYEYGFGGFDITEDDMDYTQAKDISDAYFRDGGLYRFAGPEDSEVVAGENATGLTKEEVQKMFDEYSKKMQTQYGQQQSQNQSQNEYTSFGSAGAGQPMWGRPAFAPGYNMRGALGQYGNMYSPYTRNFNYYSPYSKGKPGSPAINANALMAGSLANIQKSGMVPTKMTYSKERKQDGNFFERKLGFNKDRITTIDYAKPGTTQPLGLPSTWDQTKKPAAGTGPIGQGAVPGAQQSMNAQEYMRSQLTLPKQQETTTNGMPAGFPANNIGPVNTEMGYGGYVPMAFAYGGDIPEYLIAGEVNNQVNTQPSAIPYWVTNPIGAATNNIMGGCTDEQKKDPNSPCYEKETEQIKLKENTAGTLNYGNIMNSTVAGANMFTNTANDVQGMANTFVPETQKMIYDRMTPQQRRYTGKWDENSGTQNKMGFEGVVKKGGSTGLRENGEYQLSMDEIREILKAGGKIEFL